MKTALVMSGGGALGLAQVRAIRVLHDAGFRFDAAFGVSTGALQAAGYMVGGQSPDLLERIWGGLGDAPFIRERDIFKKYNTAQIAWRYLRSKQGIYDFAPLYDTIGRELGDGLYEGAFAGVVDLDAGEYDCVPADALTVFASACMPVYAAPVKAVLAGRAVSLTDGGVRHTLPLAAAIDAGAESIVCIILQPPELKPSEKRRSFVEDGIRAMEIAVNQLGVNDLVSALEKNEMLQVAELAGVKLVSPSGKPYRYVPIMTVRLPMAPAGSSVLCFEPKVLEAIGEAGTLAAQAALAGIEPVKVFSARPKGAI